MSINSIEPVQVAFRQRVLALLSVYRLIVSVALVFGNLWLFERDEQTVQIDVISLAYLVYAAGFFILRRKAPVDRTVLFFSIELLSLLLLLQGGGAEVGSLSVLFIVFVLAYAALVKVRDAVAMAAAASLVLLGNQMVLFFSAKAQSSDFAITGGIGLVYFIAAITFSNLARLAQENRRLAEQRGIDLRNMAELNEYIIQRMDSGVIVVDSKDSIQLTNDAAWYLLGMPSRAAIVGLAHMSAPLYEQLRNWRSSRFVEGNVVSITGASDVLPRFIALGERRSEGVLILLEDASLLNQQAQQLKHSALGRLTASIAHEIRNPLGAISHAAQLLVESEALDMADRRLVEIIHQNAGRTNTVIENVMQLTRKEQARPEQISIANWLATFVDEFAKTHKLVSGQVQVDVMPSELELEFDVGHLHQILANLCQNALVHGVEQAQRKLIQIKVGKSSDSSGVVMDVIDFGPGIDPDTVQKIFEPFFTTASRGTGLGLYIAKELASANQAKLDYVPVPSGGSCFRLTFKAE